jgi:hypothetical protein
MRNAMPIDRTPEIAGGITVISAIGSRFMENPVASMAAGVSIVVGILAVIAYAIKIAKLIRDWKK